MTFIRTVLGDIDPADMGVTYAHEHVVIAGGRPVEMNPDFLLDDVERMTREIGEAQALGLATIVDAMPMDAGRDALRLAEISRRTGVNVVAPTGLHHERYYGPDHWSASMGPDALADSMVLEIDTGIDGTSHNAGVLKVATGADVEAPRDRRLLEAAAIAHQRTGVPILTHCEGGAGALHQIAQLGRHGVSAAHVTVSHVDKVVDPAYHREIAASGATMEYDQSFRWQDVENGTLRLLEDAAREGYTDRIVLGMDAARQGYYRAYGGQPGLVWLLGPFSAMMEDRGIDAATQRRLFVDNPARAFAFAARDGGDA